MFSVCMILAPDAAHYHRYQYLRDLPWVELLFLRPFPFWAVEAVAL